MTTSNEAPTNKVETKRPPQNLGAQFQGLFNTDDRGRLLDESGHLDNTTYDDFAGAVRFYARAWGAQEFLRLANPSLDDKGYLNLTTALRGVRFEGDPEKLEGRTDGDLREGMLDALVELVCGNLAEIKAAGAELEREANENQDRQPKEVIFPSKVEGIVLALWADTPRDLRYSGPNETKVRKVFYTFRRVGEQSAPHKSPQS